MRKTHEKVTDLKKNQLYVLNILQLKSSIVKVLNDLTQYSEGSYFWSSQIFVNMLFTCGFLNNVFMDFLSCASLLT